jgi:hypothetical protein
MLRRHRTCALTNVKRKPLRTSAENLRVVPSEGRQPARNGLLTALRRWTALGPLPRPRTHRSNALNLPVAAHQCQCARASALFPGGRERRGGRRGQGQRLEGDVSDTALRTLTGIKLFRVADVSRFDLPQLRLNLKRLTGVLLPDQSAVGSASAIRRSLPPQVRRLAAGRIGAPAARR